MKFLVGLLFLSTQAYASSLGIEGRVTSSAGCGKKVMVWLSLDKDNFQERKLLIHTEVPAGGTFKFYTKPGAYQLRASDEVGCEFMQRLTVNTKSLNQAVKLVKK